VRFLEAADAGGGRLNLSAGWCADPAVRPLIRAASDSAIHSNRAIEIPLCRAASQPPFSLRQTVTAEPNDSAISADPSLDASSTTMISLGGRVSARADSMARFI
jgi:hypothetical protein